MSDNLKHFVGIAPAAHRDNANALAAAQGWGPNSYSVPLYAVGGAGDITHYGLATNVSAAFVALLSDPPADAVGIVGVITKSLQPVGQQRPLDHFITVLASMGLTMDIQAL